MARSNSSGGQSTMSMERVPSSHSESAQSQRRLPQPPTLNIPQLPFDSPASAQSSSSHHFGHSSAVPVSSPIFHHSSRETQPPTPRTAPSGSPISHLAWSDTTSPPFGLAPGARLPRPPSTGARGRSRNLSFLLNPPDDGPSTFNHRSPIEENRVPDISELGFQGGISSASPEANTASSTSSASPYSPASTLGSGRDEHSRQRPTSGPYVMPSSPFPPGISSLYLDPSFEASALFTVTNIIVLV